MRFRHLLNVSAMLATMLAGCHAGELRLRVDNAWVRLSAVPGRPAAGYLTVVGGATPSRLVAIDSADAGSSELHRSMTAGGMAAMQRLDGVDVPAGGTVTFAPAGYHVMLFGVGRQVKPGDTMPLVARFARGAPITVSATVVGAGDPPPYGA